MTIIIYTSLYIERGLITYQLLNYIWDNVPTDEQELTEFINEVLTNNLKNDELNINQRMYLSFKFNIKNWL